MYLFNYYKQLGNFILGDSNNLSGVDIHSNSKKDDKELSTKINPINSFILGLGVLFSYFYLSNSVTYTALSLFYPSYLLHTMLQSGKSYRFNKIKPYFQYFIIYSHLEFLSIFLSFFGLYLYHLKIVIVSGLLYILQYRETDLETVYLRVITYSLIGYNICIKMTERLKRDYLDARLELKAKV